MTYFKKSLALLIAVVMILALGVSAFAADDGTISISNTTNGATYKLYKVFDATYSDSNISYTYDGSNATFLAALQGATTLFEVTQNTSGSYNIVKKDGATDAAILAFIKENGPTQDAETKAWSGGNFGDAVDTKPGTGETLTFSDLAYGYYFITSTVGALVTINSAAKDVTVIDKNQETTIDKQEQVEAGTWVYQGIDKIENPVPTASVGDTVNYRVVGNFSRYVGEDKVTKFTFTDVMSNGLTADKNVVVTINGTTKTVDTDYTVTYTKNASDEWVTVINIPTVNESGEFLYPAVSEYVISYSAKINENAVVDGAEENTVTLKYTDDNSKEKEVDSDKTEVKNYNIDIVKTDDDKKLLDGATFKLYSVATQGTAYDMVLVETGVYRFKDADDASTSVVEKMIPNNGKLTIKGLKNGDYYLEEVDHPEGYNPLTERKKFTINNKNDSATIDNNTYVEGGVQVINKSGTTLPSTGGIGTTIFYVVGGMLAVGAGIVLVTRRKVGDED